jgi:hypothetical protein
MKEDTVYGFPDGKIYRFLSPMTGIVMMMTMNTCSWLRWVGGDVYLF